MPARLLSYLTGQAWAIQPEVLDTWCNVLEAKAREGKVEVAALTGAAPERSERAYSLEGPVAVVPVVGEMVKRAPIFGSGASYAGIRQAVAEALADPAARAVLLDIESPGGSADGCAELGEYLREARREKPLHAYINGRANSAAYWLAAQCQEIAASAGAQTGSIGVLWVHLDLSEADKARGVKRTFLHAGKFKAAGNPGAPLGQEDREYFQAILDELHAQFIAAVAAGRGLDPEVVRATEAKVFLAREARELGLIDLVMSREQFLNHIKESLSMDLNELKAKHPELVAAVKAEATAGLAPEAEVRAKAQAAVDTEKARILGLHQAVFGPEAHGKFAAVVNSGATPEVAQALAGVLTPKPAPGGAPGEAADAAAGAAASEAGKRQEMLAAIQAAGAAPLDPKGGEAGAPADILVEANRLAKQEGIGIDQALLKVGELHPQAYQDYILRGRKEG